MLMTWDKSMIEPSIYNVTLFHRADQYDWDELIAMMHQIHAIHNGWADPITVHVIEEEPTITTSNNTSWISNSSWDFLNDKKEDIYTFKDGKPTRRKK